jgi:hypothetical protein
MNDQLRKGPCGIQSCLFEADGVDERESAHNDSDERCINCVLDALLTVEDSKLRNAWITLLKKGCLEIHCARTRRNYRILPEFFNQVFVIEVMNGK